MTLQKADPTSSTIQGEITAAVQQKVADQATYTINFKGQRPVTAISAKGAEELYAQCVTRGLCPEIQLEQCNDKVIEEQWICDGIWRATWHSTGETYTIDARGSEPYTGGAARDPQSVINRKAMGKALRNAHLKIVPSVIREAYLAHLRTATGRDVVHSEEYAPAPTPTRATATKAPHQRVYEHAKSLGLDPVIDLQKIYLALGELSVPEFLEYETVENACELLTKYIGETPDE